MIHFHRWSIWEDTKIFEAVQPTTIGIPVFLDRQVIRQQRRCRDCNMVKTRDSA